MRNSRRQYQHHHDDEQKRGGGSKTKRQPASNHSRRRGRRRSHRTSSTLRRTNTVFKMALFLTTTLGKHSNQSHGYAWTRPSLVGSSLSMRSYRNKNVRGFLQQQQQQQQQQQHEFGTQQPQTQQSRKRKRRFHLQQASSTMTMDLEDATITPTNDNDDDENDNDRRKDGNSDIFPTKELFLENPPQEIPQNNKSPSSSPSSSKKSSQKNKETNTKKLPPWLRRLQHVSSEDALRQLQWLEFALIERDFKSQDIQDILQTIESASHGDVTKMSGMVEFCSLLLQLEEPHKSPTTATSSHHDLMFATKDLLLASILHYGDCITARQTGVYDMVRKAIYNQHILPESERLLPEDTTMADDNRDSMDDNGNNTDENSPRRRGIDEDEGFDVDDEWYGHDFDIMDETAASMHIYYDDDDDDDNNNDTIIPHSSAAIQIRDTDGDIRNNHNNLKTTLPLGETSLAIATDAARIKQVEILAHAVLGGNGQQQYPTTDEAARLRELLLSVMKDWRGLALRSAASLYRLEGILQTSNRGAAEFVERTPEIQYTARDALRIYAPLAERLGMHRLKSLLEERAFRILYRRQYQAVSTLYRQVGASWDAREAMHLISSYLTAHMTQFIQSDPMLSLHLEDFQITSRVKEPYSMWRKLLKRNTKPTTGSSSSISVGTTTKLLLQPSSTADNTHPTTELWSTTNGELKGEEGTKEQPSLEELPPPSSPATRRQDEHLPESSTDTTTPQSRRQEELSILEVMDAIALRVILKAKKLSSDESDTFTRERERLLCYYVQKLILAHWPATDSSRMKDYIQDPKPNGYQSLHHTASISAYGEDWPFEVQVRSEEMHRIAEFGVAAHWDYKLKKVTPQLTPSCTSDTNDNDDDEQGKQEEDDDEQNDSSNNFAFPLESVVSGLQSPPPPSSSTTTSPSSDSSSNVHAPPMSTTTTTADDSYIDALVTARENLVQQKVFVFLAKSSALADEGQLLSLSVGARVSDALVQLEEELGRTLRDKEDDPRIQVFRNGRSANLDEFVGNGDVLLFTLS